MRTYMAGIAALVISIAMSITACDSGSSTPTASVKPQANASAAATTKSLTSEEKAWLNSIEKLRKKMEKQFTRPEEVLTVSRMRSHAKLLRSCGRELDRLGAPSARLQPVQAIVQKACGQADKGARCFDTAAEIGVPIVGTADDRKFTRAVDCGINAQGDTSNLLADATIKGEEIKAQAG